MVNNFENYFIGPDEVNNELRGSMLDFLSYPFLPGENIVCERIEELGVFNIREHRSPIGLSLKLENKN